MRMFRIRQHRRKLRAIGFSPTYLVAIRARALHETIHTLQVSRVNHRRNRGFGITTVAQHVRVRVRVELLQEFLTNAVLDN